MDAQLKHLVIKAFALLLGVLIATVVFQLLTGRIRTGGMMQDTAGSGHSPSRLQMLIVSLLGAMQYLALAVKDPHHMPQPPTELLLVVGGSQAIFMGSKAIPLFVSILSSRFQRK